MNIRNRRAGDSEDGRRPVIHAGPGGGQDPGSGEFPPLRGRMLGRVLGVIAFVLLTGIVAVGGVYLFGIYSDMLGPGDEFSVGERTQSIESESRSRAISGDYTVLKLYYPVGGRLVREERSVPRVTSVREIASAVVNEFLSGPSGGNRGAIPPEAGLSGVYYGNDLVLYIDFNDALRRNFEGNAEAEYFLLKALNMSLMSNVFQVEGVKVLVDGRELDSLGGHLSLRGLLGEAVSAPVKDTRGG